MTTDDDDEHRQKALLNTKFSDNHDEVNRMKIS